MDFQALIDKARSSTAEGRDALEELYGLVRARLLEPLRTRVPHKARSRFDAEDVLHDAWLRAARRLGETEFRNQEQFLAWVYRIARNLSIDQARRMSAQAVQFSTESHPGSPAPTPRQSQFPGREPGRETQVERRELIEVVLGRIPAAEADVIRRRLLAEESLEEIAAALKKPKMAVKGLYARAWKRFQAMARRINPR